MRAARLPVIAAVLTAVLAAASGAQAAIIGGSLGVAPPNGTWPAFFDLDAPPPANQVTLAGNLVTDGAGFPLTAGVGCYTAPRTGANVDVGGIYFVDVNPADGTFSRTLSSGYDIGAPCIQAIVPYLGSFPVSQLFGSVLSTSIARRTPRVTSGPNAGAITSVQISSNGAEGISSVGSPREGTPIGLGPVEGVGGVPSPRPAAWGIGGQIADAADIPGHRSAVTVDGRNVTSSEEAASTDDSIPGLKALKVDNFSHIGNSVSVVMTEPFLTCPGSPCAAYQDAGIALRRTAVTNGANRVMTVTDEWSSTDGKPHSLDILFQYDVGGANPEFSMPWIDGGTFKTYTGGTVAPPPGRVSTIYKHNNVGDPGDTSGTLTLSARPASMKFTGANSFQLQFLRSLPAAGSVKIVSTYTASTGSFDGAAVDAAEAAANAASPRVTITSPATSSGSAYNAAGTAASPAGVSSVVVNGTAATVAADGTWSAPLTLKAGANSVTAVLTDGDGATDTATATVSYTPSAGAALTAAAARAAFGAKPLFKKGVLTLNLGCQGQPGQTCAIGVLLTAAPGAKSAAAKKRKPRAVTLLKQSLTIPAGAPRPVKLRLSKAALKRIPKRRGLTAQLVLTQGAGPTTATQRYKLTLRR